MLLSGTDDRRGNREEVSRLHRGTGCGSLAVKSVQLDPQRSPIEQRRDHLSSRRTAVHVQGKIQLYGQIDESAENGFLYAPVRFLLDDPAVQAHFTDGYEAVPAAADEAADLADLLEIQDIGKQPKGRTQHRVGLRQFQHSGGVAEGLAHTDDRADTRVSGPIQNRTPVLIEAGIRQVSVGVYQRVLGHNRLIES
ncbi:hypothetical protein ES708_09352 [subsurface metagenome]